MSQSAYRRFHSTETAVTKVYNDMLLAADGGQVTALCLLERCLIDVSYWMSANRLKLNPEKTELLWAGSTFNQSWLGSSGLSLQIDSDIDHVRVLGVILSSDLSLDKHVSSVCAACFFLASSASTSPTVT